MIAIFDYGAGNLRSVQNTLDEIGREFELVRDAAGLAARAKIILPGVGHFGQMMRALDDSACARRCGSGSQPACRSSGFASACRRCSRRARRRPKSKGSASSPAS